MDAGVFLLALLMVVGIPAATILMVTRMRAARRESPSIDVMERLDALEGSVQEVQHTLAETQERLDFTEQLLTKERDERRLGS